MKASAQGRDNRNVRGLATARAIERAAVHLAALHGAHSLTVDQICAEVGVSQRTFFNHFDTKEDALLGLELPRIDEGRVRAYLASPDVGVLTGALRLVVPPPEHTGDLATLAARQRVLMSSPELAQRQMARLLPIAAEVEEVVRVKLAALAPREDPERARIAARTITRMAAAMMIPSPTADLEGGALPHPDAAANELRGLDWIWGRLI